MNPPEIRIVVEARQPDGQWRPAVIIPLDDEQRDLVAGWAVDASIAIWPDDSSKESECVTGEDLWALPDDTLLEMLEGEYGETVGIALAEYLDQEYEPAITERFDVSVVIEICARRLSSQGLDGAAFRNLPRDEQFEFIARFADGAPQPVEH